MSNERTRSVLVTGGASGIGKAIAAALLADGHGVTVLDVSESNLEACRAELEAAGRVRLVHGATTREADCEAAVARAVEAFGGLQVLVNNAGIGMSSLRPDAEVNHPPIEELTPEIWHRFLDTNLVGHVRMTRAAIGALKAGGWGRIINNTTSYLSMLRVQPYGAVKSALESTSAVWAKELEASGITVNVVVPGGPTDPPFVAEIGIPREKMLRPEVMVPPVRWLVSREADGVTGRRFVGGHWDPELPPAAAAAKVARSIGWPELTGDVIWLG